MAWKPEYAENRRAKMDRDPEYAAKRNSARSRTPEENKAYMSAYYRSNPEKFKRDETQEARRNERRRERYAADSEFREKCKASSRGVCKSRKKSNRLKIEFGIDLAEYNHILSAQGGGCAICGTEKGSARGEQLHVDHCHRTGFVRGLLCSNCNQGIGKFADDPARLARAIEYLRAAISEFERQGPANDLLAGLADAE